MKKLLLTTLLLGCVSVGMGQVKPKYDYYLIGWMSVKQHGAFTISVNGSVSESDLKSYMAKHLHLDTNKAIILAISPLTKYQFTNFYKK